MLCQKLYYEGDKNKLKSRRKYLQTRNICKSDTGLGSGVYKELSKLESKKQTKRNPGRKWAKDINSHFTNEGIQLVHMHMKKLSAS